MSSTTTITETIVFPPRPPTVNSLPVDQRARLLRSSRKVGAVLGTVPRFLDDEDNTCYSRPQSRASISIDTSPPTPVVEVEPPTPTAPPTPNTVRRQRRHKLAKLQRTFGESVDPQLVFPTSSIIPPERRSSLNLVRESAKPTLKPSKKAERRTPAPLVTQLRNSSQALLLVEQDDSEWEWEEVETPVDIHTVDKTPGRIMDTSNHSAPHLKSPTSTGSISHRHTKSDVAPPSPMLIDAKRRKSSHRGASIVDFSQIKFPIEGDWNRNDMEEVRMALRRLKAM